MKHQLCHAGPNKGAEPQAGPDNSEQILDQLSKEHFEPEQLQDTQSQQDIDESASVDSDSAASGRPQYLVDLDAAEEAERKLASGEDLQGTEKEAEAPSDPVDSLRSVTPPIRSVLLQHVLCIVKDK